MIKPNMEILRWGPNANKFGTLKDYIIDCYPFCAEMGLFTWQAIYDYRKKGTLK